MTEEFKITIQGQPPLRKPKLHQLRVGDHVMSAKGEPFTGIIVKMEKELGVVWTRSDGNPEELLWPAHMATLTHLHENGTVLLLIPKT